MKNYYRIMLGRSSIYAKEAHDGNYIGAGWLEDVNLTNQLTENRIEFNRKFVPIYLEKNPEKKKMSAALACGMLYTITKAISIGDIVLCPDGSGNYYIGEIVGNYQYIAGQNLPHQRAVKWQSQIVAREDMSQALKYSTGAIGTVSNITDHAEEIERLIFGDTTNPIIVTDESIEDPSVFMLEKHLEDFLVQNWQNTELGQKYDIYEEDGEIVGQQYQSDTGPIDILAISKDKRELLVVELKRGRASDVVVGQIQRYMGYVKEELAEKNQTVRGTIIALEDDVRINRALSVALNIDFYTYKIHFELKKK